MGLFAQVQTNIKCFVEYVPAYPLTTTNQRVLAQIIINIENTAPPDPTRFVVDIYTIYKPRQLKLCQDPVKRMLHCLIETGGFQPDLPCLHGSLKWQSIGYYLTTFYFVKDFEKK